MAMAMVTVTAGAAAAVTGPSAGVAAERWVGAVITVRRATGRRDGADRPTTPRARMSGSCSTARRRCVTVTVHFTVRAVHQWASSPFGPRVSRRLAHPGLAQSCSVAALAFQHLVALLDQALAFAILALGLFLDVRAFFVGHDGLQDGVRPMTGRLAVIPLTNNGMAAQPPRRIVTTAARIAGDGGHASPCGGALPTLRQRSCRSDSLLRYSGAHEGRARNP